MTMPMATDDVEQDHPLRRPGGLKPPRGLSPEGPARPAPRGGTGRDDPAPRPKRRQFPAAYKLAILAEFDSLADPTARGALLRREGLYHSHLLEWRRARAVGAITELEPKPRPAKKTPERLELERLRRRNERLESDLAKHRLALEIAGKASELLDALLCESSGETRQQR